MTAQPFRFCSYETHGTGSENATSLSRQSITACLKQNITFVSEVTSFRKSPGAVMLVPFLLTLPLAGCLLTAHT